MKMTLLIGFCLLALSPQPFLAASATPAVKEGYAALCPVCIHYKDGSCREVKVDGKTPKADSQGKTYYFCSPSCVKTFLRKPRKFVKAPERS
jgi:YHS domain-containing protein